MDEFESKFQNAKISALKEFYGKEKPGFEDGGRVAFGKGGLLTDEILLERLKNNKGKKTYAQIAEELNKEGYYTRAGKITDSALEQRAIRGNFPKGLASRFNKESVKSFYEVSTPENIKLFEENKISEKLFRRRAISRREDLKRSRLDTRKAYVKAQSKLYRDNPANFEKIKKNSLDSRIAYRKKYGTTPPAANAKEELWRSLFTDAQRYEPGRRLKLTEEYKGYIDRNKLRNAEILDVKTGKKFTFNNLEKDITPKNTGFTYKQVIKPYNQKWFVNKTPGLRTAINQKLIKNWTKGSTANFFEIQHNAGRFNDPFDVSLSNKDVNLKEYRVRDIFEKNWDEATEQKKGFGAKKSAFKNYVNDLPKGILSKPNMVKRNRLFGEDIPFNEQLKNIEKRGVKINPEVLKKAEKMEQLLIEEVDKLPKNIQAKICNSLSNGGLPGNCADAIKRDPIKTSRTVIRETKGLKTAVGARALSAGRTVLKFGVLGEAAFVGADTGVRAYMGRPKNEAFLAATFREGKADDLRKKRAGFTPREFLVDKATNLSNKINSLQQQIVSSEREGTNTEALENSVKETMAELQKPFEKIGTKLIDLLNPSSATNISYRQKMDNIMDSDRAKSMLTEGTARDVDKGIPNISDEIEIDAGVSKKTFAPRETLPSDDDYFRAYFQQIIPGMGEPRYKDIMENVVTPMDKFRIKSQDPRFDEQNYGASGKFASGGIAGILKK